MRVSTRVIGRSISGRLHDSPGPASAVLLDILKCGPTLLFFAFLLDIDLPVLLKWCQIRA